MTVSLYEISIPVFVRSLANLGALLRKGADHAREHGMDGTELASARLYPDMLPLTGQVQRASDTARFVAVRVGGIEPVPMPDDEQTLDQLQARIDATVEYLKMVPASAFDDAGNKEVILKLRSGDQLFTGTSYILQFALPNFYFHVTTAYGILRHKGVPIGKADFLRGASMTPAGY